MLPRSTHLHIDISEKRGESVDHIVSIVFNAWNNVFGYSHIEKNTNEFTFRKTVFLKSRK